MSFADRFVRAVEDEIVGEAYFGALAATAVTEAARAKLSLLVRVERHTSQTLAGTVAQLGGQRRGRDDLLAIGRSEARDLEGYDWPKLIDWFCRDFPKYVDDYNQLAGVAPTEHAGAARLLADHEIAIVEFAEAERAGTADSERFLTAYLDQSAAFAKQQTTDRSS